MASVLAEDEETQRKGHVVVCRQEKSSFDKISSRTFRNSIGDVVKYSPVRFAAVHIVLPDDPIVNMIRPVITMLIQGQNERVRTKFYTGFSTETRYQLMSFGIPIQELPVSSTLTIKTKNHNQWIKCRIAIENARAEGRDTSGWITQPGIHDILFSPGGNPNNQGNLQFRQMMDARLDEYFSTSKRKPKKDIRDKIIAAARVNGGRFLELNRNGGWWEEINSPATVDEKVSVYFYNEKKKGDAMGRRQNEACVSVHFGAKRQRVGEETCCFRR